MKPKQWDSTGIIFAVSMITLFLVLTADLSFSKEGGNTESKALTEKKDVSDNDANEEDAFGNIMLTSFPQINKVTFNAPESGKPCEVIADVNLEDEDGTAKISSVSLTYYVGGAPDKPSKIEMNKSDSGYKAVIPPMPKGTKVDFIIRAEDTNGNVAAQAIPSDKNLILPVPDRDNTSDLVPDDLDLLQLSAGYDDRYVYISYTVQGKISGGTLEPPYIHGYIIKVTNPDIHQGEGLMVGKMWVYIPLTTDIDPKKKLVLWQDDKVYEAYDGRLGKSINERVAKTGSIMLDIKEFMVDGKGALSFDVDSDVNLEGGRFRGKVERKWLGENPKGYLRFIAMTFANASRDSVMPIPYNCSHFLTLYTFSQSYIAQ